MHGKSQCLLALETTQGQPCEVLDAANIKQGVYEDKIAYNIYKAAHGRSSDAVHDDIDCYKHV